MEMYRVVPQTKRGNSFNHSQTKLEMYKPTR